MFFINNTIKVFKFARSIKQKTPIPINELEQKFEHQKILIKEQAEKQIRHSHSIEELILLNNDVNTYVNINDLIIKRIIKLNPTNEEFQKQEQFLGQLINNSTSSLCLNLMNNYKNNYIETQLYKAFQNKQLQTNEENNLRLLEILVEHGTQHDLQLWVENSKFTINAYNIIKFYDLIDKLNGKLPDKDILLQEIEKLIHKYIHTFQYKTLFNILKYRSFTDKAMNTELVHLSIKRLLQLPINLDEIININQYISVELKYQDIAWFNFIGNKTLELMGLDKQVQQEIINNNEQDEEELEKVDQTIQLNTNNNNNQNIVDEQKTDQEILELIQGVEERTTPIIVTDIEHKLLKLMQQIGNIIIYDELNYVALSFFPQIDVHMMQFLNHLSADEQLICFKFHAKTIETYYNEQQSDSKKYKKSGKKKLEKMNNTYYEISLQCLKELSFEQTLLLLESTSVLGVSKRKVCQRILQLGLNGLKKIDQCKLDNEKKNYSLFLYHKFLSLFITKEIEINQISESFKDIKINVLDLQAEYGHLGLQRQQIIELEQNSIKIQ